VRILGAHVRASVLELLRYPSFSLSALLFPATLYLVFLHAYRQPPATRAAGFAAVAILGVVFFQFGVGIASERTSAWELFVRTLPAQPRLRIAARVGSALLFGAAAAGGVLGVAALTTPLALPPGRWAALAAALLLGGVPFGLLGIAIGYAARPRAALPLANLLYLPLSYAGGLWAGPAHSGGAPALDLVPTHGWAQLLWAAVGAAGFDPLAAALLAAWGGVFAVVAVAAYRRDEGERFR
jgi:ABC-2 type transport system permease protein